MSFFHNERRPERLILVACLVALAGPFLACQNYFVNVNNFQVARFRPNLIPSNSALDLVYDLVVDSSENAGQSAPLPISSFDANFFLEGEQAAKSSLPPGIKSLTLGQPVRMQGQIVLADVAGLAPKIPLILKKEEWDIGLKGTLGLAPMGVNFLKLPVLYQKNIPNPTKSAEFQNSMPPQLKNILEGL